MTDFPITDLQCDVAVIGAGTAGLAAERSARRAGAKTVIIDRSFSGTTCATVGCMPSKLLIAAAHSAHSAANAGEFGIRALDIRIDGKAVMQRVRRMRDDFVAATRDSIEEIAAESRLCGAARFVGQTVLDVKGRRVKASAVVIATGSSPSMPKTFEGLDNVLTNETVFEMTDLPASLAVIGAGPLGIELAQAFARLGVEVAVFDEGDTVAGIDDTAVAAAMHAILQREMPIHLGISLQAKAASGGIEICWSRKTSKDTSDNPPARQTFSHVLVAAGRHPNFEGLNLSATGIEQDDHGIPLFDRNTMQCGKAPIFLAGDVDADAPILHEASAEGAIAGNNAARFPDVIPSRRATPLALTFTDPPCARVGAPPSGDSLVGEVDYADQGRAKVENKNAGIIRLYADASGKLTGAGMAAPAADHMAHLLAWAIERGETAMDLLDLPIYHPTFEEGMRNALRQICRNADRSLADDRDAGSAPGT